MGKQSGKNPAGFGKRKIPNKFNTSKKSHRLEEENVAHSPATTSSGILPNEESNCVVSEEEMVYKEPSMYDKLLMTLGSSSKSVSAAYKMRKRQEEGLSDSENSEDDGTESSSDSEDADDDEEGVDDEFPMEGKPKDPEKAGLEEHGEDSENKDDQETFDLDDQETSNSDDQETHDSDAEQDLGTSSQSAVEPSMCLSSFDIHLGHKLTKAEVENLSKKMWIYDWEVPAVGMTKGKWAGTGECFTKVNVEHMDRFSREFGTDDNEDEKEKTPAGQDLEIVRPHKLSKPSDFQVLFGGNSKDDFMVGIKFTKRSIKLYSDFYTSDMIVASSVGLLKKIDEAKLNKEKDVDYLSSIEVLVIDHADVVTMQNWDFLKSAVEQLNRIPSKQHGTDVMRIRPWYLDGCAHFYRQTILLSYYSNPDINNLFSKHCNNYNGKVKLVHEHKGVLPKVILQVRQRFDADSIQHIDDACFEYFTTKVFPKIKDSVEGGIMIFISSYFEYVRVRNFLKSQSASFCLLHEYAEQSDISRAWVWFFEGKRKIMLYTERSHFYHRYKIRAIQNLVIYSLPERKEFYPEVVNMLDGSNDMACTVLFSQFDLLWLERIVGFASAKRMLTSKMKMFSFS
ncbi:protein NUCLEOLAR FACTOR 1-like isoform X3 [Malus sylvestris]|uniref:protein NUCLEOLAR FACTOR 1-like isoform X3 n=1 Tax=Malus sylvestris TaxID=3752 RepID=UPI0021ABB1A0|nr:protein NUCLEOLAR FACTOR 1-like isoform X3 [Malus sylvestris]